uniref:Cytoplasmic dynein 1 intermediate chain 2 n=1 Tax=Pipistrellus kuhlii TaxID=59472 RepID=A0A7J7XU23_PIPKU|nr:dynein cytoplasmic 1 intermediate chain 2 [Pipistrellus kuhlii]
MSDKSELKAELERKKQRLAQIREEKKRKEEERKKKETDQKKEAVAPVQEESDLEKKRREAEALLQSMGLTPESPIVPPPLSPSSKSVSTPSEAGSQDSGDGPVGSRTLHWDTDPSVLQLHSDSDLGRGPIKLGMAKITQVDFPPREIVTYTKETQTPVMAQPKEDDEEEDDAVTPKPPIEPEEEKILKKDEENDSKAPPHELTEEEKQQILHTEEFLSFFDHSTRIATFAKFHPNLVVGGTYSGQIVLWDNRSNKRTPVQRTPLSAAAHTHPVYCVNVVGTQNAHNLISISTDGKICSWSLDMLSHPQDSMELVHKQSKAVAVTSMSFPVGDVNNFVVGSEEGSVYTACRHGSKAGISEMFEGHQGPITGIHCHAAVGAVDFSHLFVTSSFDWTVKLWTTKNNKPLYSFEDNSDYVYDVMWSPTHPALFACVDGMGRLDLWNLNNDTEVPTASISVEGNPALNRVRWTHSGREIAVGDSEGQIVIYDVGEQIAVPRNDEWARFGRTLAEINANRADAEEEAAARIPA